MWLAQVVMTSFVSCWEMERWAVGSQDGEKEAGWERSHRTTTYVSVTDWLRLSEHLIELICLACLITVWHYFVKKKKETVILLLNTSNTNGCDWAIHDGDRSSDNFCVRDRDNSASVV